MGMVRDHNDAELTIRWITHPFIAQKLLPHLSKQRKEQHQSRPGNQPQVIFLTSISKAANSRDATNYTYVQVAK